MDKRKVVSWAFDNKSLKKARLKWLYKNGPTLRILNFHRVVDEKSTKDDYRSHRNFPKISQFIGFVEYIAENYNCVHLPDFVEHGSAILASDKPNIAITFDDGYKDNVLNAIPILRKHNIPVTLFCTLDSLDGKLLWFQHLYQKIHLLRQERNSLRVFWIDEEISLSNSWDAIGIIANSCKDLSFEEMMKRLESVPSVASSTETARKTVEQMEEMLSWDDLEQLKGSPLVAVGAHTCRHWNLTRLNDEELKHELEVPINRIRAFMGTDTVMIAYPNGRYNDHVIEQVKAAGYAAGFIMSRGVNTAETPKFQYYREYCKLDPASLDFQMYEFDLLIKQLLGRSRS